MFGAVLDRLEPFERRWMPSKHVDQHIGVKQQHRRSLPLRTLPRPLAQRAGLFGAVADIVAISPHPHEFGIEQVTRRHRTRRTAIVARIIAARIANGHTLIVLEADRAVSRATHKHEPPRGTWRVHSSSREVTPDCVQQHPGYHDRYPHNQVSMKPGELQSTASVLVVINVRRTQHGAWIHPESQIITPCNMKLTYARTRGTKRETR